MSKPAGYIMWQLNNTNDTRIITTVLGRVCYIDQGKGWQKWIGGNVTLRFLRKNANKIGNITKEDLMLELL